MQLYARILLITLFLALPTALVVQDGWASGSDTMEQTEMISVDDGGEEMSDEASDPLEGWNRIMYEFNDILYFGIIRPLAEVYSIIAPEGLRIAVRNFFHNLAMPQHFLSALLQGDVSGAGKELGRFGINTVLGLGFFDVADKGFGIQSGDEDIGQALGRLGAGDDLYLVWPVVGPSNLRDTIGLAGDIALYPLTYYPHNEWKRAGIAAYRTINDTSLRIGEYEDLKEAALDPYVAMRDAYLQMRRKKINE